MEEEWLSLGLRPGEFNPKNGLHQQKPLVQFHLSFPKEEIEDHNMDQISSKTIEEHHGLANKNTDTKISLRKKLRLTKEQSTLLENSFKEHSTLNPTQKHELAERLKLRPRQVEVWFQNRRARTKLKQTEVDCEFLKKCCESLSDENRRLKKELEELRSVKLGSPPLYIQLPKAAMLTMCPSCDKIAKSDDGKNTAVSGEA
ncbi:hypothetical protein HHK36_013553 [Tetracentron sinense]|uniref:Homeobox domain-containing protein n=1 Tax=Tetracentron sinense TaxID=13715 RepID=A0A834Z7D4_TETSI|nr:hypothetical protein HHK36_013552 [Tetracentron sinense]KAF8400256.1 hypothetical protein HHK36_013553 [Tetracentron sinense]